jgi:large subunit ribosomal protein L9
MLELYALSPLPGMEILLLQEVEKLGKKNDLVVVGDGYALNCLLPQRLAIVATPTVRRIYADAIRLRAEERERDKQLRAGALNAIAGKDLRFVRKVTKTGKLYAAITETNIVESLKEHYGIDLPESAVALREPIKQIGVFSVMLRVGSASQELTVHVEAETAAKAETKKKK